ncbi:MAG: MlaD family protein [Planctomycetota bacterium]
MNYRIGRMEMWAGAFLLGAAAILALVLGTKARKEGWFRGQEVVILLREGYGITKGTAVKVNGIRAGEVKTARLVGEGRVEVVMRVEREYLEWVRADSKAHVVLPALFGQVEINITPGSPAAPPHEPGGVLVAEVSPDLLSNFERVGPVLENVQAITENLRRGEGDVGELVKASRNVMKSLEPASANLAKTAEKIPALVDEVRADVVKLRDTRKTVDGVLAELKATMEHLTSIAAKIDRGEGTAGKLVNDPTLYNKASETVAEARDVVEGMGRLETYVDGQSIGYDRQKLAITKLGLRIVPRPTRYFYLGGVVFNPMDQSPVTINSSQEYFIRPEFLAAQKLWKNRVTLRGGLLEGKLGGGVDVELPRRWGQAFVEARGMYETPDNIDEGRDNAYLLRAGVSLRVWKYFRVMAGADSLQERPGVFAGVGFAYVDRDITRVVGLMGAAK